MSAAQMKKQGGYIGALAAGLLSPMLGKMLGGKGMQLPGTKRGRERPKKTSEQECNHQDHKTVDKF